MADTERRIVDSFWDLRDHAHDHPEHWRGIEAEAIFQFFATLVEQEEVTAGSINWQTVSDRMIAWREAETIG